MQRKARRSVNTAAKARSPAKSSSSRSVSASCATISSISSTVPTYRPIKGSTPQQSSQSISRHIAQPSTKQRPTQVQSRKQYTTSTIRSSPLPSDPFLSHTGSPIMTSKRHYDQDYYRRKDHDDDILQLDEEEQKNILSKGSQENIRNFSIIAHIDHGKSTLADRLLSFAGNINSEQRQAGQVLDKLEVERERGITIKAQTASIFYREKGSEYGDLSKSYLLNLIDCPGHVDFQYEVSRSLSACQGALLLVDASQGIQAQTLANFYIALEHDLEIIPIMTKMDLPHADPEKVTQEMVQAFGCKPEDILRCSSKSGEGIAAIFPEIIKRIPPPMGKIQALPGEKGSIHKTQPNTAPFRGLLFDSWYDPHRGVISLIKVEDGEIEKGDIINTYYKNTGPYEVTEVGILKPEQNNRLTNNMLRTGQVGYIAAGVKSTHDVRLGDTFYSICHDAISPFDKNKVIKQIPDIKRIGMSEARKQLAQARELIEPLPGFEPAKSMVFAGIFPSSSSDFTELCAAVEKLTLNDPSVIAVKEQSGALGSGYRCGFLGMLHMDVFVSRLEREYGIDVITTTPTVPYRAILHDESEILIDSPATYPKHLEHVETFFEPMTRVSIITPPDYVGPLTQLCNSARGELEDVRFLSEDRAMMRYKIPLAEVVVDFYQQIKSLTSGYASLDYEVIDDQPSDVVKLDIRLNGESVDALSVICHRSKSDTLGRRMITKLKENIDRQNYEVVIQCAIGAKILGRERIAPYRRDVLIKSGKLVGGGDNTRKMKLLEKQKEGKKRMKAIGNVEVSDKAFLAVMKAQSHGSSD